MAMSTERRNEIAYLLVRHMMADRGVEIGNDFRREVGRQAKSTGVPFGEMLEFATAVVGEMLADVSNPKKPPTEDELSGHGGH